jgi:hypothetical protein
MATEGEDLRLNTLHRHTKRSPHLVLQVHSHCEVPAGCGGVVLRWIDPAEGLPVVLRVVAPAPLECHLDGRRVELSRATLPFGEHILAFKLQPCTPVAGDPPGSAKSPWTPFIACAVSEDDPRGRGRAVTVSRPEDWRGLAVPTPPHDWTVLDFADGEWPLLSPAEVDAEMLPGSLRWSLPRIVEAGATALAVPAADSVFVRHRFRIAPR